MIARLFPGALAAMKLGDISHELRTPLSILSGAAEILAAQAGDRPALAAAAMRIQRATSEMIDKVSTYLLLSRSPEALDKPLAVLKPLIEREAGLCRPLLDEKPVALHTGCASSWRGGRCRGARTSGTGRRRHRRPAAQCMPVHHAGDRHRASTRPDCLVEDTGPRLPDDVRKHLFERFVASHDECGGSGLGLSLVRRVAAHLKWQLQLEQRKGGGSRWMLRW